MLKIDNLHLLKEITSTNVYVQDKVLDDDLYIKLLETFPNSLMARKDVHKKEALNKYNEKEVNSFLSSNKDWRNFVNYFYTPKFLSLVNRLICSGHEGLKRNKELELEDITVGYEFSILKNGARVVPHKDKYGKLFSFVFYFVPANWDQKNTYGGTQFYKPKNTILNRRYFNNSSSYQNMVLLKEIKPLQNRLLIFEPNSTSWHGVYPIKTEDNFGRPAFIVTVHRKETFIENFYNLISLLTSRIQKLITE